MGSQNIMGLDYGSNISEVKIYHLTPLVLSYKKVISCRSRPIGYKKVISVL
jgi:hypothetical protein